MSDQVNIQSTEQSRDNIMKELSDIKSSLAVNTNETSNIKATVNEIKQTIKDIQNRYITQEDHKILSDTVFDHETRIRKLELWGAIALGAILLFEILVRFIKN